MIAASPRPGTSRSRSSGAFERLGELPNRARMRLGERLGVAPRHRPEQHQLQQLVIGQGVGAGVAEAPPQPLAMAEIMRLAGILEAHSSLGPLIAYRAAGRSPLGERVKIWQPVSVTPTVCSNCADSDRSRVTAVQPSDSIFTGGLPRLIIGSMVKSMPGLSCSAFAGLAVMQDVRPIVEHAAQAVAAEIAHHAAALRLRHRPGWRRRCRRWWRPASPPRCRASARYR